MDAAHNGDRIPPDITDTMGYHSDNVFGITPTSHWPMGYHRDTKEYYPDYGFGICPPLTASFEKIYRILRNQRALQHRDNMISVDPFGHAV